MFIVKPPNAWPCPMHARTGTFPPEPPSDEVARQQEKYSILEQLLAVTCKHMYISDLTMPFVWVVLNLYSFAWRRRCVFACQNTV